jgi:acyl-CoA synthetase (AMP-forming)/AMP-acid ligase II
VIETEIRVVEAETAVELAEGSVGEIWIRSPGVADGYFIAPDGFRADGAFGARGADGSGSWLRTGDLGFLDSGDLVIVGRLKDLVIIRGRNHHPVDIETTASGAHPAIMPGRIAAFGVEDGVRESLVLLVEINPRVAPRVDDAVTEEIRVAIQTAVSAHHDIEVEVIFVKFKSIPTTSSGKIRRSACRSAWQAGCLPIVDLDDT